MFKSQIESIEGIVLTPGLPPGVADAGWQVKGLMIFAVPPPRPTGVLVQNPNGSVSWKRTYTEEEVYEMRQMELPYLPALDPIDVGSREW